MLGSQANWTAGREDYRKGQLPRAFIEPARAAGALCMQAERSALPPFKVAMLRERAHSASRGPVCVRGKQLGRDNFAQNE